MCMKEVQNVKENGLFRAKIVENGQKRCPLLKTAALMYHLAFLFRSIKQSPYFPKIAFIFVKFFIYFHSKRWIEFDDGFCNYWDIFKIVAMTMEVNLFVSLHKTKEIQNFQINSNFEGLSTAVHY